MVRLVRRAWCGSSSRPAQLCSKLAKPGARGCGLRLKLLNDRPFCVRGPVPACGRIYGENCSGVMLDMGCYQQRRAAGIVRRTLRM
jgi:hypothetical protein